MFILPKQSGGIFLVKSIMQYFVQFDAVVQTLVNNSTRPCYSKNIRYSAINWGRIVGRLVAQYSTRVESITCMLRDHYVWSSHISSLDLMSLPTRGRITRPLFFIFTNRNRVDLGHRVLVFASTANVESGPRFSDTRCSHHQKYVSLGFTGLTVQPGKWSNQDTKL